MKRLLFLALIAAVSCAGIAAAADNDITAERVIAMTKDGAGAEEMIREIAAAGSRFAMSEAMFENLKKEGVPDDVVWFMRMEPGTRPLVLPYLDRTLNKQDIIDLTKKGVPKDDILLLIARTKSRFTMTAEETAWMEGEGVDPWVIKLMKTQYKTATHKPFLERGAIERDGAPVRGGKYYDDAVAIKPGKYRLDHQLRGGEYDYFKMKLRDGQKLIAAIRTPEIAYHGAIAIHDAKKTLITEATIYNSASAMNSCSFEVYDEPEGRELYIVIGCAFVTNEYVIYDIRVEDHFDAGSGTDAGRDFGTALAIKPATYEHNWLPAEDIDTYIFSLRKGESVAVRVTPAQPEVFRVSIMNADRETVATGTSKEQGSVAKAAAPPAREDGKVYCKVDHNGYTYNTSGKYALGIEVRK